MMTIISLFTLSYDCVEA